MMPPDTAGHARRQRLPARLAVDSLAYRQSAPWRWMNARPVDLPAGVLDELAVRWPQRNRDLGPAADDGDD